MLTFRKKSSFKKKHSWQIRVGWENVALILIIWPEPKFNVNHRDISMRRMSVVHIFASFLITYMLSKRISEPASNTDWLHFQILMQGAILALELVVKSKIVFRIN